MAKRQINSEYEPRGAIRDLFHCRTPELLLSGPAGTGKSVGCLWKVHYCATHVPGLRALILRKTRASLTDSAMVTFERDVLPEGHSALTGARRENRHAYHYKNESEIVCGGMDKPSRIMSTDYDLIYVQEAIELLPDEWEALTTRLRNGRLPYQQLLADTNPDKPTHWLKRRCDVGATQILESRHQDNPLLWNEGRWTDFAHHADKSGYIDRLDNLTGARLQRLRHGRWVQAEGVVYEGWDASVHLIDRLPPKSEAWPRYLSIDFGFTNPFVCQWWAKDPDGRLYLYREIYRTQRLVEDHARTIKHYLASEPRPFAIVCDTDAEGRATLAKHLGLGTTGATKNVSAGIQAVAGRLRLAKDGKPRLLIVRDALVERDDSLADARKPTSTAGEIDGYVWDTTGGQKKGDQPLKVDDHGMDAMRYMVAHIDGVTGGVQFYDFTGQGKFGCIREGIRF
jgi:PBSX family phage terminase large subunit